MNTTPGPMIRRWQLGQELRQLREKAGVEPKVAAAEIEVQPSTLSKIEGGKQSIKGVHVKVLAPLYGISFGEKARLLALAEEANQPGWWTSYGKMIPDWFKTYLGYESEATTLRTYESELINGLLQIPDYVRSVAHANRPDSTPEDLERSVELRRARQERTVSGDPPEIHTVINEAALHRLVGGPDVMRAQLAHLLEIARLPHVTLQVLPFAAGAHPAMTAPFTLLSFDQEPGLNTVYLENGRGALYLERPADLERYRWMFGRLAEIACSPKKSADLIGRVKADM